MKRKLNESETRRKKVLQSDACPENALNRMTAEQYGQIQEMTAHHPDIRAHARTLVLQACAAHRRPRFTVGDLLEVAEYRRQPGGWTLDALLLCCLGMLCARISAEILTQALLAETSQAQYDDEYAQTLALGCADELQEEGALINEMLLIIFPFDPADLEN